MIGGNLTDFAEQGNGFCLPSPRIHPHCRCIVIFPADHSCESRNLRGDRFSSPGRPFLRKAGISGAITLRRQRATTMPYSSTILRPSQDHSCGSRNLSAMGGIAASIERRCPVKKRFLLSQEWSTGEREIVSELGLRDCLYRRNDRHFCQAA